MFQASFYNIQAMKDLENSEYLSRTKLWTSG